VIGGPRGSMVVPFAFDWYLLVGDETALPAIGRRIEEMPEGAKAIAILEVDNPAEEQSFASNADLTLHYVHRNGDPAGPTTVLADAVTSTAFPEGVAYAYVAGEVTMSHAVRDHLTSERGFNPEYIKAAGYWRYGVADAQEDH